MDYYGFKLVAKNRTYHFYTDFITELNKWATVIANCSQKIKTKPNDSDDDNPIGSTNNADDLIHYSNKNVSY